METKAYTAVLIHGALTEPILSTGSTTFRNKRSYSAPKAKSIEAEGMVVLAGSTPSGGPGMEAKESTFDDSFAEDDLTSDSSNW